MFIVIGYYEDHRITADTATGPFETKEKAHEWAKAKYGDDLTEDEYGDFCDDENTPVYTIIPISLIV